MPPKKAKKKPPKPPLSSTSNDKKPTAPSAAAKKKELADGKKTAEIKQLQDSLSSFFTPTGSRRSRHPPAEPKIPVESSVEGSRSPGESSHEPSPPKPAPSKVTKRSSSPKPGPSKIPKKSTSPPKRVPSKESKPGPSKVRKQSTSSSSPKPGPSRVAAPGSSRATAAAAGKSRAPQSSYVVEDDELEPGTTRITWRTGPHGPPTIIVRKGKPIPDATASSSPEPCSSKTTAAELVAKKNAKKKAIQFRKPGVLPKGYKAGKASSSSSEDDGCESGEDHPARMMPDPRYYYKGFYFAPCKNSPFVPGSSGPIELIESIKSMEEINRMNPNFKEFEVDSDTEYESEPDPVPEDFDSVEDYLKQKCQLPKKMVKVIDGMTKAQRREHRQFALEFREMLNALKDNHMATCDGPFKTFSKPFIPPEGFMGRKSDQILKQAQEKMNAYLKKYPLKNPRVADLLAREPANDDPDSSPSSPSSPSQDSDDDEFDDDGSAKELVDFTKRFSDMDLKPLINMHGMGWRELLPKKPPKDGESEASSESSVTTDSDDDPKPLDYEVAANSYLRPPEWDRYRSSNERVLYRRYIRRACRTIVKSNARKKQIHKFLEIGSFAPKRPIPAPPTRIEPAIVDDDELMEIPNYMSAHEMIMSAPPEQREILIEHFNNEHRRDVKRIREYEKAAVEGGPVPAYIYTNKYQMKTKYTSPLPFHLRNKEEIFLCDQCLDAWIDRGTFERHGERCQVKRPPGNTVYKDDENGFAFFEVDALTYPTYCQMLCCLGISYIEHKSLHTDIEPFLFYVLAKKDKDRDFYRFIGYFSKQKYGHSSCNLCCLLVLPCYQGKGYGRYIIDFSFLLSRVEKIPGTPERPLSEAADYLYYRYYYESFLEMIFSWWQCNERDGIDSEKESFNLDIIEQWTGIQKRDMARVLHSEGIIDVVRFPDDPTKQPKLKFNIDQQELIDHMEKQMAKKNRYWIKRKYLNWKPEFGVPEERAHFPLIQAEYEAREAGLLFENPPPDDDDEEPESPAKPAKKGRKKKGEKKVAKGKKKKMVVPFRRTDTNEEFDAKNPFEDLTRSAVFTNKDFLYQTLPYVRRSKKNQKKRPTASGKRRKSKKKKEAAEPVVKEESEEEDIPDLFVDPTAVKKASKTTKPEEKVSEEDSEEESADDEPKPCSSKTPAKPAAKPKGRKPSITKKKSPPKRRGRKPGGTSCKDPKDKQPPPSSDEDSDDDDHGPGSSRRPTRPRGRKRTTTPKAKGRQSEARTAEAVDTPGGCTVMPDLSKSVASPKKAEAAKGSSDEDDSGGHHMRVKIRGSSVEHSSSDSDNPRPLPLQKPLDYHTFSSPLDDTFQMSPQTSPRRSQKRSSRNRSVSFSRNPKESRTSSDYDETNLPTAAHPPPTSSTPLQRSLGILDNNYLNMDYGNTSNDCVAGINQLQQHQQQQVHQQENVLQHDRYPYHSSGGNGNNRNAEKSSNMNPGKEETEMPKLLPTALEVPIERMEINNSRNDRNDVGGHGNDEDDDDDDDDAPPMLSPNFATANTNHSPSVERFTPPNLHSSNDEAPPMMDAAPPMLQSAGGGDSVQSHRAPDSLQNPASRRSSTEMQQQSHSVPSQSIIHPQQQQQAMQQPMQQQMQQQAWQLQNEMYNSAAPQLTSQQHPQQVQEQQQPRSHPQQMTPQQMTPQQPPSMPMSDPNSVYSMHSVQSQPPTMPSHLPPQQQQQQMHYPPPLQQQETRKSIEHPQQLHLPNPQQLIQQQLQQQMLQPVQQQQQISEPKPKPKPKKKKKESTASAPSSSSTAATALPNPMFPQQKYPNPYDAATNFSSFFPPASYMAQMAQFQGHGGYSNYVNPYSTGGMPNPVNYPTQQFNPAAFGWPGQPSSSAYPGYPPSFMQQSAAVAAAAAASQQHQANPQKQLYPQIGGTAGNPFAAMGGASGSSGSSGAGPSSSSGAVSSQNPMGFNPPFPSDAAAAVAAAQWTRNQMAQNPPPPYNLPPTYPYFPQ